MHKRGTTCFLDSNQTAKRGYPHPGSSGSFSCGCFERGVRDMLRNEAGIRLHDQILAARQHQRGRGDGLQLFAADVRLCQHQGKQRIFVDAVDDSKYRPQPFAHRVGAGVGAADYHFVQQTGVPAGQQVAGKVRRQQFHRLVKNRVVLAAAVDHHQRVARKDKDSILHNSEVLPVFPPKRPTLSFFWIDRAALLMIY